MGEATGDVAVELKITNTALLRIEGQASRVRVRLKEKRSPLAYSSQALVRRLRRLPIVHKANYPTGSLQFLQELAHCFGLPGQNQTGPDISQRLQDKLSQVQSRVRQLQSLIFNVAVAVVEQVDVDLSRNIFYMLARAAERFFDSNQLLEQTRRIAFVIKFNDRVQKFVRPRFAIDRLGFVNWRGKNRRLHICEIGNCTSRGA